MKNSRKFYGNEVKIREYLEKYKNSENEKEKEEILNGLYEECKKLFSYYYLKKFGFVENFETIIHTAVSDFVMKVACGEVESFATKFLDKFLLAYTKGGTYYDNNNELSLEDSNKIQDLIYQDSEIDNCMIKYDIDRLLKKIDSFIDRYKINSMIRNLIFVSLLTGYSVAWFGLTDIEGIISRIKKELRNNGGDKNYVG